MYAFEYHRPTSVRQAANLLGKLDEAKIVADGNEETGLLSLIHI